mmetsp:Transcript_38519/g.44890  ORF Transcript_38519/g.44890 Transcript_38519/m.44890 type:complete len:548 (+) Transcript_38519:70-1713(+)|eukprot:CAMPEP_0194358062 /NCGR_PEP_ID=MMETSP0174-20130528/5409_1 /TAXON_ID=216777 /ORGANISM="Proboscia alata, Strain PI-D3" /LENGTH=547 /DNA_ID=CAMNT_0039128289 /DNA_START=55 /DNA_END=1698 /DNA_ORIENTATION=+
MSDYSDEESYHYSDEDMEDQDDEEDGGDDEEFDFSSDGDNSANDFDVSIENAYYNAKGLRETDVLEAAVELENVVSMELSHAAKQAGLEEGENLPGNGGYGSWSYKAIKQLVKLHLLRTNDRNAMMQQYRRLLLCCVNSGKVTQNQIEKGINGILERVGGAAASSFGHDDEEKLELHRTLKSMYNATLDVFRPNGGSFPNERLWFKTNLKLGQLLHEMNEISQLQMVIRDLLRSQGISPSEMGIGEERGENSSSSEDVDQKSQQQRFAGTHLLEIYALQIQLYSRQKDNKKVRELYNRAMRVEGGIPHPRTIALIQEVGGKCHMANQDFEAAGKTFFQAFKSYDEAGDPSRLKCLKYLVMASMLHASSINPFDSQEARPYKDDPEIVAMTNLVQAFHSNEIRKFEAILKRNEGKIMDDEFVREHVAELLRTIRTQVLQSVLAPYTRISLGYIARELNDIATDDVESLLVALILDGKLDGRIDQVNGVFLKSNPSEVGGVGPISNEKGDKSSTNVPTSWGSNTLEARNCLATNELAIALEHLSAAIVL